MINIDSKEKKAWVFEIKLNALKPHIDAVIEYSK